MYLCHQTETQTDSESSQCFNVEFSGLWADSDVNTGHIDQDEAQFSPQRLRTLHSPHTLIKLKTHTLIGLNGNEIMGQSQREREGEGDGGNSDKSADQP